MKRLFIAIVLLLVAISIIFLRKSVTISDLASDVTMVALIVLALGIGIKGSFKKDQAIRALEPPFQSSWSGGFILIRLLRDK